MSSTICHKFISYTSDTVSQNDEQFAMIFERYLSAYQFIKRNFSFSLSTINKSIIQYLYDIPILYCNPPLTHSHLSFSLHRQFFDICMWERTYLFAIWWVRKKEYTKQWIQSQSIDWGTWFGCIWFIFFSTLALTQKVCNLCLWRCLHH